MRRLQRAMDARRIDKDYLAIVRGKPSPQRGTIDLALDRDPWDRRRVTVTDRGGQPSVTRYERLSTANGFSLVRCRSDHRPHASDPRAPGGEALADRRRRDVRRESTGHRLESRPRRSFRGRRCMRGASHFASRAPDASSSIEAPMPEDMKTLAAAIGLPA